MTTTIVPFEGTNPEDRDASRSSDPFILRTANTVRAGHARLGRKTARKRRRKDRKLFGCERQWRDGLRQLDHHQQELARLIQAESQSWAAAKDAPDTAPEVDRGRRGLSNRGYLLILALIWAINVPIGIATFQIFEEPMVFTVLLALLADTVILLAAHGVGVTFRRHHLEHDGGMGLGVEYVLGWVLLALGIGAAVASAWARWRYLALTGSGSTVGIVFSTILMLLTFIVAVWAAWRHHHPQVADAERATRRREHSQKAVLHAQRVLNRVRANTRRAFNDRRHLAQQIVGKADRIETHYADGAFRRGLTLEVSDSDWLRHERQLAALPELGAMVQPVSITEADLLPRLDTTSAPDMHGGQDDGAVAA